LTQPESGFRTFPEKSDAKRYQEKEVLKGISKIEQVEQLEQNE